MKKLLKTTAVLFALVCLVVSCEDDDNARFEGNSESGWIEFNTTSGMETIDDLTVTSFSLPLSVNVPVYKNGLNVSYSIEAVSGDYTQIVNASSGAMNLFLSPTEPAYSNAISLELMNLDSVSEEIVFDVVLNSVDASSVSIGLNEDSFTTIRVTKPCGSGIPTTPTAAFTGDYSMVYVGGDNPLAPTTAFLDQVVTISSNSGIERQFSAIYLEALALGNPAMDFVFNFSSCGQVSVPAEQATSVGCGPDGVTMGPNVSAFGSYNEADDTTFTIDLVEFYTEACGVTTPSPFQLVFTKL